MTLIFQDTQGGKKGRKTKMAIYTYLGQLPKQWLFLGKLSKPLAAFLFSLLIPEFQFHSYFPSLKENAQLFIKDIYIDYIPRACWGG